MTAARFRRHSAGFRGVALVIANERKAGDERRDKPGRFAGAQAFHRQTKFNPTYLALILYVAFPALARIRPPLAL